MRCQSPHKALGHHVAHELSALELALHLSDDVVEIIWLALVADLYGRLAHHWLDLVLNPLLELEIAIAYIHTGIEHVDVRQSIKTLRAFLGNVIHELMEPVIGQ